MTSVQQLLVSDEVRVIGFAGGKGRDYLSNRMASELSRSGKTVVISSLGGQMMAPAGYIVAEDEEEALLAGIQAAVRENPLIFAGRGSTESFVKGITSSLAKKIARLPEIDYLFLIVGTAEERSLLSSKTLSGICKLNYLDELIFCFQIDNIEQPLNSTDVNPGENFFRDFPALKKFRNFDQQFIRKYLSIREGGILCLFQQKWPAVLVFTDINNVLLENHAINLTRDLFTPKIRPVYLANLKEDLIKKVPIK